MQRPNRLKRFVAVVLIALGDQELSNGFHAMNENRGIMTELPRYRPGRIPAIHPVPEFLADSALKQRYESMKATFQVPWMGVVTMAYAHYRTFYDTL